MALPDFLIIGAMKCGTSTLAAQLAAQEQGFVTTPKEPEFFSEDANHARGTGWYESLFRDAPDGAIKGEASTGYTKLPTHPEAVARIHALLPEARLVYLIRNPLDRLVSHYIHEWTMGVIDGDIRSAITAHPELVDYSCYGRQIAPYLDAFGHDRVLLVTLEEMKDTPQQVLERVARFIGMTGPTVWHAEQAQVNASAERFRRMPLHGLLIDNPVARTLRQRLVPKALRDRIRRGRQITVRPVLDASDRAALIPAFERDRDLLRRQFPGRPDIERCYPFLNP